MTEVRRGPCDRVFSGVFIGTITTPQFRFICRVCFHESQEPFIFGPPFKPSFQLALYNTLVATKAALGKTLPPCPGDYGNPTGVLFEGQFQPGHL